MKKIELPPRAIETLFGVHDQNIKYLESLLDVRVDARGQDLTLDGDPKDVETAERIIEDFAALFREGKTFTDKELREAFAQIAEDRAYSLRDYFTKARFNPAGKKQVAPKTANQRRYIEAIQNNDVVFGIGVAGTGKSYLAVAMAIQALMQKQVSRIVLARPAVEAGERLGFLPGDLQDKVDPYLRPLYDALFDLIDAERVTKLLEEANHRSRAAGFHARKSAAIAQQNSDSVGLARNGQLASQRFSHRLRRKTMRSHGRVSSRAKS